MFVNFWVTDAVGSIGAEQLDRGVGKLSASLGRVVLPTCGDAAILKPAAMRPGGSPLKRARRIT
jgi:hypothetical protein